ncbi:hypothetical protein [Myxococcus sp. RHSTA-1-4]|uniref:hypothetical protein n=1 Tax=Myxococcus sp. RHSTA-1-4 TaxID=2874601 RepID=UPI001CBEBC90|nr:hypothetical protein [Myxococcus sp. RHSTA-1-4]MBZ4417443.1 hypothetical protein [Myxococcus sp. RHSTA-1-4]
MEPRHPEVLHLLMSRAGEHRPFLERGLPVEAAGNAPEPEYLPERAEVPRLEDPDAAPRDLAAQRWGVIAPEGTEGDAMLQALKPLLQHRAREQGAEVRVYRVPAGMDAAAAVKWSNATYRAEQVPEEERPKYLLLLGDLHQVSIELQQVLAPGSYVGRLHVATPAGSADLEGYASYAEKVRAFETGTAASAVPEVVLYVAADGSEATRYGRELLVEPFQRMVETQWMPRRPGLALQVLTGKGAGLETLLDTAAGARAGVMLSVSHGLGLEAEKASEETRWAQQGALDLGAGQWLTREQVRDRTFLPGGMWFCLACFGAATPARSMYHPWLAMLAQQQDYDVPLDDVLKCLPGPKQRPFLAALPQAALANPSGPLAVIGHSDLAWLFSFSEGDEVPQSRASRVASVLKVLANGGRAGVALGTLMRESLHATEDLMADYDLRRRAELDGQPDPIEPKGHALRWMLRNDLRGYILLGDPAARLSFRSATV